jgi:hypothetical protein
LLPGEVFFTSPKFPFGEVFHQHGGNTSTLLQGIAAGWSAKKLGGGCLSIVGGAVPIDSPANQRFQPTRLRRAACRTF